MHPIPALLLVLFLASTTIALRHRAPSVGLRGAYLSASIVLGLIVLISTELLSLARQINAQAVAAVWLVATVAAVVVTAVDLRRLRIRPESLKFNDPTAAAVSMLAGLMLGLLGWLAIVEPPNAIDGLIYHLPRLMHWQQDQSVDFYPTNILRQLHMPPLAEYVMLDLALLTGSTDFSNLVQWLSLVGCAVGASLIAAELGSSARGQALAALLCATLPIAVVQAYGPKNDLVTAYWFICLAWLLIRLRARITFQATLAAAGSVGLALATKGSSAVIAAGPLLVFGCASLAASWRRPQPVISAYLTIGLLGLACAAPQASRNLRLYGSPIGPNMDGPNPNFTYSNRAFGPRELASNMVRNVAVQLSTPWQPVNDAIMDGVVGLHVVLGIEPSDEDITFGNQRFNLIRNRIQDELAANPLHTLLLLVATLALAWRWPRLTPLVRLYMGGLVLGFVLFSVAFAWQVSTTRFQLPLLMLGIPIVGLVLQSLRAYALAPLVLLMFIGAGYVLAENRARPLVGPHSLWEQGRLRSAIGDRDNLYDSYIGAGAYIGERGCSWVGLQLGWDDIEQPWWFLIPGVAAPGGRVEHVGVTNVSGSIAYPRGSFMPCAIVNTDKKPAEELSVDTASFDPAWVGEGVVVYLPRGQAPVTSLPYAVRFASQAPSEWAYGEQRSYAITLTNDGTRPWSAADTELSIQFATDADRRVLRWRDEQRFPLPQDIAPGESVTLTVNVQAPRSAGRTFLRHRLVENNDQWFSQVEMIPVEVLNPPDRRR